jgi:hypothetical protein
VTTQAQVTHPTVHRSSHLRIMREPDHASLRTPVLLQAEYCLLERGYADASAVRLVRLGLHSFGAESARLAARSPGNRRNAYFSGECSTVSHVCSRKNKWSVQGGGKHRHHDAQRSPERWEMDNRPQLSKAYRYTLSTVYGSSILPDQDLLGYGAVQDNLAQTLACRSCA